MRKWGVVISVFYAAIVLGILVPTAIVLCGFTDPLRTVFSTDLIALLKEWLTWVPIAAVLSGQALLLFVSVDTTQKKLKPRAHIAISVTVASMLFGLLTFAMILCVGLAAQGDSFLDKFLQDAGGPIGFWGVLWILWAIMFYVYFRRSTSSTARAISWLLKGSVLELLIAVPCHVIVRRRGDCSAPILTSFGIVTGVAVMLLSFGPSVLFLFKKRLDGYSTHKSA